MAYSRLRTYQDKKEKKQITLILGGMFALLIFLAIFGVKILVAFSLFVDKIRGTTPATDKETQSLILPPVLDPLPEATNSAQIVVSGRAKGDVTILLYVNEEQTDSVKLNSDGTFEFTDVKIHDGLNVISTKAKDSKNISSDLSEVIKIRLQKEKPKLELSSPSENAEIKGEKQQVTITGKTDPENTITINDRMAVVQSDGEFTYDLPLSEGEQTLTITATDMAGNETKIERKVKYSK